MPSIRTFRTFLAVARHGTFAGAGREIGLTPAAVGLQIRAMEQEMKQVFFDRGGRSVVLNAAGRRALPQIDQLVWRYESMIEAEESDELSGTVVMGALVSALMGSFADALWSLKARHRRLEVQLFGGMSSEFAGKVEHGELDAAIVTQSPKPLASGMVWTRLYTEPMVLIVPRRPHFALATDPIAILGRSPFLQFERQTWTGHLIKQVLDQCGASAQGGMELNSVEAIIELVRQGFGVSIVPQLANVNWKQDSALRVMKLPGIDVQRRVGLLERVRHNRMRFTTALKQYFDVSMRKREADVDADETALALELQD
ncbi:MAG: LysR family transcriptional regulator [Caldimonas sp.]